MVVVVDGVDDVVLNRIELRECWGWLTPGGRGYSQARSQIRAQGDGDASIKQNKSEYGCQPPATTRRSVIPKRSSTQTKNQSHINNPPGFQRHPQNEPNPVPSSNKEAVVSSERSVFDSPSPLRPNKPHPNPCQAGRPITNRLKPREQSPPRGSQID